MSTRPDPGRVAPPGYHLVAAPDPAWRLCTTARRCRWMSRRRACGLPTVAEMLRGVDQMTWWAYCGDHLYGRWIEDNTVMTWTLKEGEPE